MSTQILDKLIQSQWGKSLIMWFFVGMGALITALLWALLFLTREIKEVNQQRALDAVNHSKEISDITKDHIADMQNFINRLSEVEKRKKK